MIGSLERLSAYDNCAAGNTSLTLETCFFSFALHLCVCARAWVWVKHMDNQQ